MTRAILYIWAPLLLLGFSSAAVLSVFTLTSPRSADFIIFLLAYLSVFLLAFSLLLVIGYHLRTVLWPQGSKAEFFRISLRQGILLGLLTVGSLMLQASGLLNFWTGALLLIIFVLVELYSQ